MCVDQAGNDDVQQEGRHTEKYHREDGSHGLQALELFGQKPVRSLVLACEGAMATIARNDLVELHDDVLDDGAFFQFETDVIEGAFHIVGGSQCSTTHP